MPAKNRATIEEFTSTDPVCVHPDTKVEEVIALLRKNGFRHLPVVNGRRPVGIISDRDILLARPMGALEHLRAREVMTTEPYSVNKTAPLEDVVLELSRNKFGSALVVKADGDLCGIFTTTDALNALVELLRGAG